jgi:hypothetical protein
MEYSSWGYINFEGGSGYCVSPPKRERTNTIARPGLTIYAAPRRIPHLHTAEEKFFLCV